MVYNVQAKHKNKLLFAMMECFASSETYISLEGYPGAFDASGIEGISFEESSPFRRVTRWPRLDFVVIPLNTESLTKIKTALGGTVSKKLIHVAIGKAGVIVFIAFDNFQHINCSEIPETSLEELARLGALKGYCKIS